MVIEIDKFMTKLTRQTSFYPQTDDFFMQINIYLTKWPV